MRMKPGYHKTTNLMKKLFNIYLRAVKNDIKGYYRKGEHKNE